MNMPTSDQIAKDFPTELKSAEAFGQLVIVCFPALIQIRVLTAFFTLGKRSNSQKSYFGLSDLHPKSLGICNLQQALESQFLDWCIGRF